jgi:hypothetical protein
MITAADITARMRAVPFVPFRITTSAGQTFDIVHRDFAFVTRRYVEVGTPHPDDPDHPDKMTFISMLHITSVETLPQAATTHGPGANGTTG